MFSYKIFRQGDNILLAISDSNIIGKTFRKNNVEISVSEDFYSDRFCDEKKVTDLIKNATIVNAIGKDIINLMLKEKFIEKENILEIDGVPHAQIITLK
jgi:hypothetical protein